MKSSQKLIEHKSTHNMQKELQTLMSIHQVRAGNQRKSTKQDVATPHSSAVATFKAGGET